MLGVAGSTGKTLAQAHAEWVAGGKIGPEPTGGSTLTKADEYNIWLQNQQPTGLDVLFRGVDNPVPPPGSAAQQGAIQQYQAAHPGPIVSADPNDATAGKTLFGIHASPTGVLGGAAGLILGGPIGAVAGYNIGANSGGDAGTVDVNGVTHPVTESNPFANTTGPAGAAGAGGGAPVDFNNPALYGYGNFSPGAQQQSGFYNQLAAYQQAQQAPVLQRASIDWSGYGSPGGSAPIFNPQASLAGLNIAQGPSPQLNKLGGGVGGVPAAYDPQAALQGVNIAQGRSPKAGV